MASPTDRTRCTHSTHNSLANHPHYQLAAEAGPVVLFDPDGDRAEHVLAVLRAGGLDVRHEAQFEHIIGSVQEEEPAAVVVPWPVSAHSARSRDLDLLEWIRTRGRQTVFLAYAHTNRLPISDYCRPLAAGARQVLCLQSPTFAEDLRDTLLHLIDEHQARLHEKHGLRELFASHGLVGRSSALQEVFRRALRASHFNDLPVMILGDTGTGKQRLAEAIHAIDPRRADKPFLTLNCSAIHKSLAESTLFGHARGAFSGSTGDRLGVFRAAHGGTLLLDEIGELDLELQPKLLRVLQEQRVVPVGEDYEHPVDVRIITATNRPLAEMVRDGRFREDLF
ncbi:MAG TPA: sigma-54 factor interaction domain-containing protein, partial [Gemmataceae bacterium]|nr:sigma-54 factor interaction domain-containing protein [Gemmataceae bacterium]